MIDVFEAAAPSLAEITSLPPFLHGTEDEGKRRGLYSREVAMYLLERATLTSLKPEFASPIRATAYASAVCRGVLVLSLSLSDEDEDGDGDGSSSWDWVLEIFLLFVFFFVLHRICI